MSALLVIQVAASFLVGGLFIAFVTTLSERIGTRLGGIIAGTPSTVLVSLFFQGLTLDALHAAQASSSALLAFGAFGAFTSTFIYFTRRGFWVALTAACVVWFLCVAPIIMWDISDLRITLPLFILFSVGFLFLINRKKIEDHSQSKNIHSWQSLILRVGLGGAVIALSVAGGALLGETVGGVLAAFPAASLAAAIVLYHSSGLDFVAATLKGLFIGATTTISVYMLSVYFIYPVLGIWWGTFIAYSLSLLAAYILIRVRSAQSAV